MFDLSIARIARLSMHLLNHDEEDGNDLSLSDDTVSLADPMVTALLEQYTIKPFQNFVDYQSFTYKNGDHTLNPLAILAGQMFDESESFHESTQRIAQHLHQNSNHHGIKSGDLMVALISDVTYEDEMIDAIGIFKSEQKDDFLKMTYKEANYNLQSDRGVNINKLDKGCIIFNTGASAGYVVASVDRTGKTDAQYWNDNFLQIKPLDDAFHATQQYMNMAQTFVSHRMGEEVNMNKGEQLGILNDAGQFFKKKDTYSEDEFKQEVLGGDHEIIESFQNYKKEYAQELQVDLPEQFGISNMAVKKSAKDFKSVLKLDKNFHVYIHGDRKLIEHGRDEDGRKFYKLYYEEEA